MRAVSTLGGPLRCAAAGMIPHHQGAIDMCLIYYKFWACAPARSSRPAALRLRKANPQWPVVAIHHARGAALILRQCAGAHWRSASRFGLVGILRDRSIDRSGSPFGCCRSECGYVHGWLLSPCGRKVCQNPQDNVRDLINEKKIVNVTLLNFVAHICGGARRTTVVQHVALPAHATCAPLHAARAQNMQHPRGV